MCIIEVLSLKCQLLVHTSDRLIIEYSSWLLNQLLGQHLPCSKSNLCCFMSLLVLADLLVCVVGTGQLPTQEVYCIAPPAAWQRGGEGKGLGWAGLRVGCVCVCRGGYMWKHYTSVCLVWSGRDWLVIYETDWYPSPVLTLSHSLLYALFHIHTAVRGSSVMFSPVTDRRCKLRLCFQFNICTLA